MQPHVGEWPGCQAEVFRRRDALGSTPYMQQDYGARPRMYRGTAAEQVDQKCRIRGSEGHDFGGD